MDTKKADASDDTPALHLDNGHSKTTVGTSKFWEQHKFVQNLYVSTAFYAHLKAVEML